MSIGFPHWPFPWKNTLPAGVSVPSTINPRHSTLTVTSLVSGSDKVVVGESTLQTSTEIQDSISSATSSSLTFYDKNDSTATISSSPASSETTPNANGWISVILALGLVIIVSIIIIIAFYCHRRKKRKLKERALSLPQSERILSDPSINVQSSTSEALSISTKISIKDDGLKSQKSASSEVISASEHHNFTNIPRSNSVVTISSLRSHQSNIPTLPPPPRTRSESVKRKNSTTGKEPIELDVLVTPDSSTKLAQDQQLELYEFGTLIRSNQLNGKE
ncbi:hypothetical protein HK098_006087 [Nowakowskiella sp. JEL0407]|nr:hypothetical protein HK098_006087 [Nowakowskiella sp. JEL0407]